MLRPPNIPIMVTKSSKRAPTYALNSSVLEAMLGVCLRLVALRRIFWGISINSHVYADVNVRPEHFDSSVWPRRANFLCHAAMRISLKEPKF